VIGVRYRAHRTHAAAMDETLLAGIQAQDHVFLVAADDLGIGAGRTGERADPTAGMSPRVKARWERLRAWRASMAKSDGVPAYVIFHDATLAEIARNEPDSIEDLSQIPGIGARKLERFGSELLEVVGAN